jgi:RimJ/RimL family protein N-acetyltransferase
MDVDRYLRWLSNHEVVRYSERRHTAHTVESQRQYIRQFNQGPSNGEDLQFWEIQRTGIQIGSITAHRNTMNRTANIGIMIGESKVWGNRYGIEAWEAVTDYLFTDNIRKVEAGCMASNGAMISILKKAEFIKEATIPNYFLLDGKPEDMEYYGKYSMAALIWPRPRTTIIGALR